jgi:DNA polymerase-3 subunit delta'
MSLDSSIPQHADQLPQLLPAEANPNLVGHQSAFKSIIDAYEGGKLHHAWLIAGQKGIGKATFAFNVAKKLLIRSGDEPADRVAHMLAHGAHPNVKVIRRAFNHKTGKFAANISVDTVRNAVSFFQTSAAGAGLRICIVDSIDDMNANAANALLKTLEEPPSNTLFLLVINRLGATLPTIRSRCRLLKLAVLNNDDVLSVVNNALTIPDGENVAQILDMARGRPRKAFEAILAMENPLLSNLASMLQAPAQMTEQQVLDFASQLASAKDDAIWKIAIEMLTNAIAAQTKLALGAGQRSPVLANALAVWEKTDEHLANQAIFNLDKKQTIITILDALRDLDRAALTKADENV